MCGGAKGKVWEGKSMSIISKIRTVGAIIFFVAIMLVVIYHQEIGDWISAQIASSMESQLQHLLR